jgi:nitric oxide reductase NorQ protein
MSKKLTEKYLQDFFEERYSGDMDEIKLYIYDKDENIPTSTIASNLAAGVRNGLWEKVVSGVYVKKTKEEVGESMCFDEIAEETVDSPTSGSDEFILNEEQKQLIKINATKVIGVLLLPQYITLRDQMRDGTIITSLFIGPPGTGKTTVVRRIAHELNYPVYSQNYALNCEELDIIGGFIPDEANGGFKWEDGQFTRAFRNGGIYIAEEPNYAKPGVLGVMNNALDGVGELVLRNGEVLQRHAKFRFFGCMNVGLVGTQRMNTAFVNRMNKVMKFAGMPKDQQMKIIMKESGYHNKVVVLGMIEVAEKISKKIHDEQIDGATISIRNLINWAKDTTYTKSIVESSYSTVVWSVCMDDDEVQKEIFDHLITPKFKGVSA